MHPDEKIGWKERDADQMEEFRESLSRCGLFGLGFVGLRFTWCNRRFSDQRMLLFLHRMVANDEWIKMFPEAKVHNCQCRHQIIVCWFCYLKRIIIANEGRSISFLK